jgi:hypothetical protein
VLLALAAPEEWPCALVAGAAVLALLVEDVLVAAVMVDVAEAAEVDDDVAAFDGAAAIGFNTVGLEMLDEMALINIAHSSHGKRSSLNRLSTDFSHMTDKSRLSFPYLSGWKLARWLLAAVWGCNMHIHGNLMQSNAANLYSAAAAEKAVAAQRAADVRKKLMKGGLDIDGELNPEAGFMVGRWLDGEYRQQQGQNDSEPEKQ